MIFKASEESDNMIEYNFKNDVVIDDYAFVKITLYDMTSI